MGPQHYRDLHRFQALVVRADCKLFLVMFCQSQGQEGQGRTDKCNIFPYDLELKLLLLLKVMDIYIPFWLKDVHLVCVCDVEAIKIFNIFDNQLFNAVFLRCRNARILDLLPSFASALALFLSWRLFWSYLFLCTLNTSSKCSSELLCSRASVIGKLHSEQL